VSPSFEGVRTLVEHGVRTETTTIRVDGDDVDFVVETRFADGRATRYEGAAIDGIQYITVGGRTEASPLRAGDVFETPYGQASAEMIVAVLDGATVTEGGQETIAGVLTTRYDIALTAQSIASLTAVPQSSLAWFDLDNPDEVDRLTVWVADGLIRQVMVDHDSTATTGATILNVNGEITIAPPPGPYAQTGGG
jgi:hypothetical protein